MTDCREALATGLRASLDSGSARVATFCGYDDRSA